MFGGRSWFDPDFFKQPRESWVRTQFVQTGTDAVFPEIRNATVFMFHASGEATKGFVKIAQTCMNEAQTRWLDIHPLSEFA